MENVPEFQFSRAADRLRAELERCGYRVLETLCCASELGLPARRRRFYLVASLDQLARRPATIRDRVPLSRFLDPNPCVDLRVPAELGRKYESAMDVVDANDPLACCACFTSAYGRSVVRSGSYLRTSGGLRRFSPAEILRLLGFPPSYQLPAGIPARQAWPLVGNSVCVPAVRRVLEVIPELA